MNTTILHIAISVFPLLAVLLIVSGLRLPERFRQIQG